MELAVRNWKQGQEPGNREEEAFYKTIEKNLVIIGKETKNLVCTKYRRKWIPNLVISVFERTLFYIFD